MILMEIQWLRKGAGLADEVWVKGVVVGRVEDAVMQRRLVDKQVVVGVEFENRGVCGIEPC